MGTHSDRSYTRVLLLSAHLSGQGSMINGNALSGRPTRVGPPVFRMACQLNKLQFLQDHEDIRGSMRANAVSEW